MSKKQIIIICIWVIGVIILTIIYFTVNDNDIKSILLGILSSIIASIVFTVFSESLFANKSEEIVRVAELLSVERESVSSALETLKIEQENVSNELGALSIERETFFNELEMLNNMVSVLDKTKTKGIIDIRDRSEFENEFWIKFADTTNKRWVISGRTLNRWLDDEMKEAFRNNINRILSSKGEINFIIYKNLDQEEEKEKERLHKFLVDEIFPNCCIKTKKGKWIWKEYIKLKILEVDKLPYLYNDNDYEVIVAPYFTYNENTNNVMFVLKRSCKYGKEYYRDFQHLINHTDENSWKTDYVLAKNRNEGI